MQLANNYGILDQHFIRLSKFMKVTSTHTCFRCNLSLSHTHRKHTNKHKSVSLIGKLIHAPSSVLREEVPLELEIIGPLSHKSNYTF